MAHPKSILSEFDWIFTWRFRSCHHRLQLTHHCCNGRLPCFLAVPAPPESLSSGHCSHSQYQVFLRRSKSCTSRGSVPRPFWGLIVPEHFLSPIVAFSPTIFHWGSTCCSLSATHEKELAKCRGSGAGGPWLEETAQLAQKQGFWLEETAQLAQKQGLLSLSKWPSSTKKRPKWRKNAKWWKNASVFTKKIFFDGSERGFDVPLLILPKVIGQNPHLPPRYSSKCHCLKRQL